MNVEQRLVIGSRFQVPGLRFNGELRKFYELGAGAGIDTPCPAGKNLVNLVDFSLRDYVRVRGQDNLVDFSPAAEPGAFSITENTERTEKNGNFSMGTAKGN